MRYLNCLLGLGLAASPLFAQPVFFEPEVIARYPVKTGAIEALAAEDFNMTADVIVSTTSSASDSATYATAAQEAVDDLVAFIDAELARSPDASMHAGEIVVHLSGLGTAHLKSSWSNATDLVFNSGDAFDANLPQAYSDAYSSFGSIDPNLQSQFASDVLNITPWMSNGDIETRRYVQEFADRYRTAVNANSTRAPGKFLHDMELYSRFPVAFMSLTDIDKQPTKKKIVSHSLFAYWKALQDDSRFSSPLDHFGGSSLSDVYENDFKDKYDAEFGIPSGGIYPPSTSRSAAENEFFQYWWWGFLYELIDRAVHDVIISEIEVEFPHAPQSNYWTSMRIDSANAVNWDEDAHCPGNTDERYYEWTAGSTSNLQSPVLYAYKAACTSNAADYDASLLQRTRDRIEACADSFNYNSNKLGSDVVPYVNPVGTYTKPPASGGHFLSEEAARLQLAVLRSKDVSSFVVYESSMYRDGDETEYPQSELESAYEDTTSLVTQVWNSNYFSVSNISGLCSGSLGDLEFADGDGYSMEPITGLIQSDPTIEIKYNTGYDGTPDTLRVHYELSATLDDDIDAEFEIWDFDDKEWVSGHSFTITDSSLVQDYADIAFSGNKFINDTGSNGRVKIRLTCVATNSALPDYTVDVDLIQIVDATALP